MPLSETGWSEAEELIITTIQQAESVPRAEAIRRMHRRKNTLDFARSNRKVLLAAKRLCRNPRCTRGEDGGPGSLAHLRADARYCDETCKKQAQRSPNRQNQASNRQCLCGTKRDKSASVLSPYAAGKRAPQISSNREFTNRKETA